MLSAQKNYLFKIILETSKPTRKFSKTQYVTTDDVYYYKRVLVLKVNFEFPLDYSKPIDISLNSLKLSVRVSKQRTCPSVQNVVNFFLNFLG
jgi:hypothetical protein